MSSFLMSNLVV